MAKAKVNGITDRLIHRASGDGHGFSTGDFAGPLRNFADELQVACSFRTLYLSGEEWPRTR